MNKKGITITELIVSFIFVLVITLSMMKLIVTYQSKLKIANLKQQMDIYQWEVMSKVENDIKHLVLRNMDSCPTNGDSVYACINLNFNNGSQKQLKLISTKENNESGRVVKAIEYDKIIYLSPEAYYLNYSKTGELPNNYFNSKIIDNHITVYYINLPIYHEDLTDINYGISIVATGWK